MTFRCTISASVLLLSVALSAQQGDRARIEALSRRAADRLQSLQQEADRLASEERTILGDLRKLEVERQLKNEELAQTSANVSATTAELTMIDQQIAKLEQEDLAERPELKARLVSLYKLGQGRYLRLMLSISDVRSIGQASRLVSSIAARDRERIASHQERLATLKTARGTLQTRGAELAKLKQDAERARAAADRAVTARNALIANIDSARDLNAQYASELETARQKLQSTLKAVGPGTAAADTPALPITPFRGDLDWPVSGRIKESFGHVVNGRPPANGIEIAAAEGTAVHVIHDGTVAFADTFAGFGKLIIVDHGGQVFSLYGSLLDMAVAVGAHVSQADVIGTVGTPLDAPSTVAAPTSTAPTASPATPTGPSPAAAAPGAVPVAPTTVAPAATPPGTSGGGLYFELRIDGRPVDPLQWLRKR